MSREDTAVLDQPERGQLLQMLVNFEQSLLGEVGEVRKMIALVRNGGYPPPEETPDESAAGPLGPPAEGAAP